jgi:hypothetical protein
MGPTRASQKVKVVKQSSQKVVKKSSQTQFPGKETPFRFKTDQFAWSNWKKEKRDATKHERP